MANLVGYGVCQRYAIIFVDAARQPRMTHSANIRQTQDAIKTKLKLTIYDQRFFYKFLRATRFICAKILTTDQNCDIMMVGMILISFVHLVLPSGNTNAD